MNKFKYIKLSRTKRIRYLSLKQKNSVYIVFLHGFMSDLEGKKPKSLLNFAKQNKLGFLALEYSGHGKSSGKFTHGNISKWSSETKILLTSDNLPSGRIRILSPDLTAPSTIFPEKPLKFELGRFTH